MIRNLAHLVGSRTGAVARRSIFGCIRGFPLRARLGLSVAPSPAPAASHVACGFTALRAPAHFTPRIMWPVASRGFREWRLVGNPVLLEESQSSVQPFAAPPLPAVSSTLAGSRQVTPHLLLHPVSDVRETPTRVAKRKVVYPAAQDRVDLRDQPSYRPRTMPSENLLELAQ